MSQKSKGCDAERELIHLFWATNVWTACRVAGSGSMHYPAPDIIAATQNRRLAIECKSCKGKYQYLEKQEVAELKKFAEMTACEPWIGLRFNNQPWYFIKIQSLKETDKNFAVTKEEAQRIGKLFIDLTQQNSQ